MKQFWILAIPLISFLACGESSSPTAYSHASSAGAAYDSGAPHRRTNQPGGGRDRATAGQPLLSDGTTQAVAASSVSWQASDPDVVTISTTGMLSALNAGIVGVHGTYQQWTSDVRSVTVTSPGPCIGCWNY
jgi:hypothetical protein